MTTKHTPTPWEHEQLAQVKDAFGGGYYELMGGSYRIGEVSNFNGHEQNAANAAFIVRAVNHHEALVAMVRRMCDASEDDIGWETPLTTEARTLLAQLDAEPS